MVATILRNVAERSNALRTAAATFGSRALTSDIGAESVTGESAARLVCVVAISAAIAATATVRFRAVFAISVSPLACRGGKRSRKLARVRGRTWGAYRRLNDKIETSVG